MARGPKESQCLCRSHVGTAEPITSPHAFQRRLSDYPSPPIRIDLDTPGDGLLGFVHRLQLCLDARQPKPHVGAHRGDSGEAVGENQRLPPMLQSDQHVKPATDHIRVWAQLFRQIVEHVPRLLPHAELAISLSLP